ncbi:DNA repair and recombination protein rad54b [Linnemannia exigua]|uniref:DNA repair and recombination protein rad54b n=1 Tax=Linnemannia exigua TaxID=604196 RepID=A0AAD4D7D0_9FUNG|nr:DNA repair and recombination protein rad54b [Linnemannia exigua]
MQRAAAPSQSRKSVLSSATRPLFSSSQATPKQTEKQEQTVDKSASPQTDVNETHPLPTTTTRLQLGVSQPKLTPRPVTRPFKSPMPSAAVGTNTAYIASKRPLFKSPVRPAPIRALNPSSPPATTTSTPLGLNKRKAEATEVITAKEPKLSEPAITTSTESSPSLPASKSKLHTTLRFRSPNLGSLAPANPPAPTVDKQERCFNVLWRKKTGKKHKTWDGDGVLIVNGSQAVLKDMDGKEIGKGSGPAIAGLSSGNEISFAGKDIEVPFILRSEHRSHKHALNLTTFKNHASVANAVEKPWTAPQPRHNPDVPHALLLPRPSSLHPRVVKGGNKRPPGDIGLVDVVVDPLLGQYLRPHQREGVRFLYECVMQMKDINGQGAILADEMGLGKTLQTIALLWTLLKQSPYHGEESSVVKRALVVCPASLVQNWQKEFKKWLGTERLRVLAVDSKSAITDFTLGKVFSVMIIGYEKLRTVQEEIKNVDLDLIVCDEGHRLKTANIKTAQAIRSLSAKRRIILTGTPIQNDLGEFFAMIDFVNPGLFDNYNLFKKVFEDPIVRSRQPDCSKAEAALGLERSRELTRLTGLFILRRTAEVNDEFLPPKSEAVVFCRPSMLQRAIYRHIIDSPFLKSCLSMDGSRHLSCIIALRKLCNSPRLILDSAEQDDDVDAKGLYSGIKAMIEQNYANSPKNSWIGGKLSFVDSLLQSLKENTSERVVLVSNFTQTLDILQDMCTQRQYKYLRLDGSTPAHKRQELVMFDIEWNPSVDQQAMARIHREGQKRPVFIYRMLLSGTIEEKMYQRQMTKIGLSDALMDGKTAERLDKFSRDELKDLFTFHEDESCLTHSLLSCHCATSSTAPARGRSVTPGARHPDRSTRFLDEPSAELVKKELLQEWTHVEVDSWRKMIRQQGKDPIEPEVYVRDRILWNVLSSKPSMSGKGEGSDDPGQEDVDVDDTDESDDDLDLDVKVERGLGGEGGVVSFVFLRSAAAVAPPLTLTVEDDA